jgi:tetratricopeptide (TPR) repeat protein
MRLFSALGVTDVRDGRAREACRNGGPWVAGLVCLSLVMVPCARSQRAQRVPENTVLEIQQKIASGDLGEARTLLSAAMGKAPADGGLENLLGVVEVQQGQVDEARKSFQSAIEHSPSLGSAYLNLGRLLLTSVNTVASRDEALQVYLRLEKVEPSNREAHYQIATLLLAKRAYASSLAEAERLPTEDKARANVQAILCADRFGLQQLQAGEQACMALARNPEIVEQDAMLAFPALRQAHRADLVVDIFSAVQQRAPMSAAGLRLLGLAQEAQGRLDPARTTLERAYEQNSADSTLLVDLTRVALAQKDYQSALGYLAHARAIRPQDPSLAFEYGLICSQANLLGEALKATREALALAPENAEYNLQMGALTTLADDPARALPYLQKYHSLRPSDPKGDLALGAAYFEHNEYEAAVPWLKLAAQDPDTTGAAHYYMGTILSREGHGAQAIDDLLEAARRVPTQPDVHAQLGQVYLELGRLGEAQGELERALALDPDHYAANVALARLYGRLGDPRREQQAKRVAALREDKDRQYSLAMRVISAQPLAQSPDVP